MKGSRANSLLVSGAFAVLVGTALWLSARFRATTEMLRRPLISEIEERAEDPANVGLGGARLVVVVRLSDCGGLALLRRAQQVADSVNVGTRVYGLVVGAPVDTATHRALGELSATMSLQYRRPSDPLLTQFASLGHVSTPMILVFDGSERLRFILPPEDITPAVLSKIASTVGRDANLVAARDSAPEALR